MNTTGSPENGLSESQIKQTPPLRGRFALSNLPIRQRLPLLIGTLLFGIFVISALASYREVRESSLVVGRERLLNLTQQLTNQSQQSLPILLNRTFTVANDPAIRAFLSTPSSSTRSSAVSVLQQFAAVQDPSSLQVQLWTAEGSLLLTLPDTAPPEPADLTAEFKQSAADPFKAVGPLRVVKDIVAYTAVAAVKEDAGKLVGYLVRWRRVSPTPNAREQLADLLGSQASLYYGNSQGDVWTDLEKRVPKPPVSLGSTLEVAHYTRDGNPVMALGRPINGTPWFVVVEFPERVFLSQPNHVLRRMLVVGFALLLGGVAAAFALSRSITSPLNLLTESASGISGGDYSSLVHIRRNDELGALGNAFNSMVVRLRGSQRDLERKIQELKLVQEGASKLAAIVESSHDAIIGKTLDGTITSWNKGAERLYGYSAEEVVGRSITILAPANHSHEVSAILERLRRGESIEHFETERFAKEGRRIFVSLTISPIRDSSGRVIGASTIARDITEQNAAEEARRASEVRYRRLFESAKDGILILNAASGQIIDANPFLVELLGYSLDELKGKKLWEIGLFKDVDASKDAYDELLQRGYARYENLPLQTRIGRVKQVEFVSNSYLAGETLVIQCNIRDITERRRAEEDLQQMNQHLEGTFAELQTKTEELASMTQQLWQASKLATMGELAASIAHELNNPLATVALRAEALMDELSPDDPKLDSVKIISQEVDRMATLVGNLLKFSRRSQPEISTLDLREELVNSMEFIEHYLRSHKVDVVRDFAGDLPSVHADRQQLRQVFLNLLTNASDAMPHGGTLTLRAFSGILGAGPAAVVEFADTGTGVKTGDLPKLWEPFFTTKPEGEGTGLGLAICRRTVEQHRGTIDIETGPGKGATVRITLPAIDTGDNGA